MTHPIPPDWHDTGHLVSHSGQLLPDTHGDPLALRLVMRVLGAGFHLKDASLEFALWDERTGELKRTEDLGATLGWYACGYDEGVSTWAPVRFEITHDWGTGASCAVPPLPEAS